MAPRRRVKKGRAGPCRLVGVVSTLSELRRATTMKHPPDLFELRLDHLGRYDKQLKDQIPRLRAPFIVTARAPSEGGAGNLSARKQRQLLLRYLPQAAYVDLELRSAKALRDVLETCRAGTIGRIISFHDFDGTPSIQVLSAKAVAAERMGADFFKVATRTASRKDIAVLIEFTTTIRPTIPVCAMGLGRLGRQSRVILAEAGSAFVYGSVGRPRISGQPSIAELRSALALS